MKPEREPTSVFGTTASGAACPGLATGRNAQDQLAEVIGSIMQSRPDLEIKIRQRSLADLQKLAAEWGNYKFNIEGDLDFSPSESLQRDARIFNTALAAFPADLRERVVEGGYFKFPPESSDTIRLTMFRNAIQKAVQETASFVTHGKISPISETLDAGGINIKQSSSEESETPSRQVSKFAVRSLLFGGLFCICLFMVLYSLYEDENPSLSWTVLLGALWSSGVVLWDSMAFGSKAWAIKAAVFLVQTIAWVLGGTAVFVLISASLNPSRKFLFHDYFFAGCIIATVRITIALLFPKNSKK